MVVTALVWPIEHNGYVITAYDDENEEHWLLSIMVLHCFTIRITAKFEFKIGVKISCFYLASLCWSIGVSIKY